MGKKVKFMVEIKLGQEIEVINEDVHLWLPVEFAREVVKRALDAEIKSIEFINLEDPETGEVVFHDSEVDRILICNLDLKSENEVMGKCSTS